MQIFFFCKGCAQRIEQSYSEIRRPRALSTRIWHCHLQSSPSATPHPSLSPNNLPPRPTPPSLTSLLNQGLSLADAKNSKEKCAKCSAALRSNTGPVRCSVCSKGFHQKCSTGPKASTRDNPWKFGNAPTSNRTVCLNLKTVYFLVLLTHFLPKQYLLLCEIS